MPPNNVEHTNVRKRKTNQKPYTRNRAKQAEENLTKILQKAVRNIKNPAPSMFPIYGTIHQATDNLRNNLEFWKNAATNATIIDYFNLAILIQQEAEKRDPTREHFQDIHDALQKELKLNHTQWRTMKRIYTLFNGNRAIIEFLEEVNLSDLWHINTVAAQKLSLDINLELIEAQGPNLINEDINSSGREECNDAYFTI